MTKTTREQAKERRIEISSVVAKWFDLDPMSDGASQESLVDSIEHLLEKERLRVLDFISSNEGWEESRDIYAKKLKLPVKYGKK